MPPNQLVPIVEPGSIDLGLARPQDGLARLVALDGPGEVEVLVRVGRMPGPDGGERADLDVVLIRPVGWPPGGYRVADCFPVEASRIIAWPAELSKLVAPA